MTDFNRRDFLKRTALGAAAISFSMPAWSRAQGANSDIRVAQIGFNSQGAGHIQTLRKIKGVRLVALCDPDRKLLEAKKQELGGGVAAYTDIRQLLDSKEVDAVSIATPNHWHALATIWACQAGKDVYVEKPVSHNLFEGRKMVEAARKYKRIVQSGTQCRSSVGLQQGVAYVRSGKLGKILLARGFCYKGRKSIGLVDGPQQVPDYIDYNLWCGPASDAPPRRNGSKGPVHYDWHWFWEYGNGDYGNQGPHQVDICRWFLGEDAIAPYTMAIGGRVGYRDSAETPNTMIAYHGYKIPMLFEVRGLPRDKAAQDGGWEMDSYKKVSIGNVIECEGGTVVVPNYTTAVVYDRDGKEMMKFDGKSRAKASANVETPTGLVGSSGGHHENWIHAIRTRKTKDLASEVVEGHLSAGLVHTGNISYRLGSKKSPSEIKEQIKSNKALAEAFERMAGHLDANGVDVASEQLRLGMPLEVNPKKETFVRNAEADAMLSRNYRAPFVVPNRV